MASMLFSSLSWIFVAISIQSFLLSTNVVTEARGLAPPATAKITPMAVPDLPFYRPDEHLEHDHREVYIVYMGSGIKGNVSPKSLYQKMLSHVTGRNETELEEYLLHTYEISFHGFAVKLTSKEAMAMTELEGVVSVFRSQKHRLHTTRSWDFLGVPLGVRRSNNEGNVIVGVLDSGVWPESESFRDNGLGPIPSKWKGICDPSLNFTCNRKLVGARYSRIRGNIPADDVASPRDVHGHGTHTASTAAGAVVPTANFLGFGKGTARGGVPSARVAVYKVCWSDSCFDEDILAAFDHAIRDGVDVLSVSLGIGKPARPYFRDSIAIGSFHAMKKGVFTSVAAGNSGPEFGSVENTAPWLLSVAGSTIDRTFLTDVELIPDLTFEGISINPDTLKNQQLIYGGDAQNFSSSADSSICEVGSLDPRLVRNKIVLCMSLSNGAGPFLAGASGVIMSDDGPKDVPRIFPLPTSYIDKESGMAILNLIRSRTSLTGGILRSTESEDKTAPVVASFSSRGPSLISPGILKPDLSAPGVDILAAWTELSPTIPGDTRRTAFKIISGTSMACPHATGVAAYIKAFRPTWSPAAIQSALITTAMPMDPMRSAGSAFAYGAGHLNPLQAVDPGLVYEASEVDYVKFLCGIGYNSTLVQLISSDTSTCAPDPNTTFDLNYPSMMTYFNKNPYQNMFTRTVTNVGSPNSTYKVTFPAASQYLSVKVDPDTLEFTRLNEKKSFTVMVWGTMPDRSSLSSYLVWGDGNHKVRSQIVIWKWS